MFSTNGTPVGINVGAGTTLVSLAGLLVAGIPTVDLGWRCAVITLVVGVFAALTVDPLAVVLLIPITWLIMDGFLVNRLGDLTLHGRADGYRLAWLTTAGFAGLVAGGMARAWRGLAAPEGAMPPEG